MCAIAQGDPEYRAAHEVIYEDAEVLVFLNRCPVLRGYTRSARGGAWSELLQK